MKRLAIYCGVSATVGLIIGMAVVNLEPTWNVGSNQALAVQPSATAADRQTARGQAAASMTQEERTSVFVYENANPSVVNISTRSIEVNRFLMMQREAEGAGSGAVFDKEGHIITNYHVVEGADRIEVTMASNKSFLAKLVGGDKEHDIAILKIDAPPEDLRPVAFGYSADLRVGQRVFVLGNPFGWDGTLTTGIISSLNRDLPSRVQGRVMRSLIQTDAAMNPGNSGGPLLNTRSQMIGMCVAIATKTGQNAGVGFAIPIDRIRSIVPELLQNGRVVRADSGVIDVVETDSGNGVVIRRLDPEGPAAQAGLQGFRRVVQRRRQGPIIYETETLDRSQADRIIEVDGEAIRSGAQFRDKIWEYRPGDVIYFTVEREGQIKKVAVTLRAN
ncbi:MAG: trypsin-like serine protease [Planctomycetes bacterium]|nr:trypsin-like serine protease [Planctomycetota bacterium]